MKRTLGIALVTLFAFASLGLAKVHVDYDRQAHFDSYKTFAWMEPNGYDLEDAAPLLHKRVVRYIEAKMQQGGLKEVTSNPDLLVTYYVSTQDETQINTVSMGYGYGPGWGWGSYYGGGYGSMGSTAYVSTYTKGTMIIDVVDAKTKQLIWRGTMENTVPDNPEKVEKKIFKGIDKIVKKYQKMRKKQLKEEAKAAKASS